MSAPSSPEARQLVRSFSDGLEDDENDKLGQALINQEARDERQSQANSRRYTEWSLLLQGDDSSSPESLDDHRLRESSQKLVVAWRKFVVKLNKKLPPNERIALSEPPNFAVLRDAVGEAQSSWQTRREATRVGRFHHRFANVIQSFDDYKELLKVVPSDDKYICLLTGSLSAFAKASINHEDTAEGINDALQLVCENLEYWKRKMRVHRDNSFMRSYIVQLCVLIFEMYSEIFVEWSSSKWSRFLNSFDSQVFKKLVGRKVGQMQELAQRLEREANLSTEDRIHNKLISRDDLVQFRIGLEESLGKKLQSMLREDAATFLRSLLTEPDRTVKFQLEAPVEQAPESLSSPTDREETEPEAGNDGPVALEHLRAYLSGLPLQQHQTKYQLLTTRAHGLTVGLPVYRGLHRWISGSGLPCLWLSGPYGVPYPSQNTLTATFLVSLAEASKLSVISHFCTTPNSIAEVRSFRKRSLMLMLQRLILQLLPFIDEKRFFRAKLSDVWSKVLSSLELNIQDAISILRDLIKLRNRTVICIIDGIFLLDGQSEDLGTGVFESFVDAVAPEDAIIAEPPLRTCFTTDGHSNTLAKLVHAERAMKVDFDIETEDREEDDDQQLDKLKVDL